MFDSSGNQEAVNALAEFKVYAAGTLVVLDLVGTFVFALSGAVAGVKERLDLFGVLVLSFAAASAGGITRDLLSAQSRRQQSATGVTLQSLFSPGS